MSVAYSDIARVLTRARRRHASVVLGAALATGLSAALACLLAGAALLGAGAGPAAAVRLGALALATLAGAIALAWAVAGLVRGAWTERAVARAVGKGAPDLSSDLLSSVELEHEYLELARSGRYSVALVDEHIARTAERAASLDLARAVPSRPARRALLLLAATVLVSAAAAAVSPRTLGMGWRRLTGAAGPAPASRAEPITGDIELEYVYPAYMKRAPKTLSGTGGEVVAPKGTEVRLKTRSDRPVERAEIEIEGQAGGAEPPASQPGTPKPGRRFELQVKGGRELSGRFAVEQAGSYRFRFLRGSKVVAEGPPLPISVEPDAPPEVRITAPAPELEIDAQARVRIEWSASDDFGLDQLSLVVKPPESEERRTPLRALGGARHEGGTHELDLAPYRLAEGERLLYWLEVTDDDTVSGPKRAASATHAVSVYSEAQHQRAALARAQALWEDLVRLLGDRLAFFQSGDWTPERVAQAQAFDGRTRSLHEELRAASQALRRERAAPRQLSAALANVAGSLRALEQNLSPLRGALARTARQRQPGGSPLPERIADLDGQLDRELERDVLYLEQLLDKQRADGLLREARELAARRRELASLVERYRQAPTEQAKKELLAEVARMKARMREVMRRMAELAKGISDEHMNQEALAELSRSRDALGGLDEAEKRLAQGDVEGAMKALDRLGEAMDQMLASLERTAGTPGQRNAELMREMLAFKRQLEAVRGQQEQTARETAQVKGEYGRRISERLRRLDADAARLEAMAAEARREIAGAERGVSLRSEDDFMQSRDRLADLHKALQARDLDAALESARRAVPPLQRLAVGLADDAAISEKYHQLQSRDPAELREAQRHAVGALAPARKVKDELERMFPDPRTVLGERDQEKLSELAQRQGELERRMGALRQKMSDLAQRAPVFPQRAGEMLGGSQGHMQRAEGELQQRDPQRGHGEQREALEELARFQRGLDEMAKGGRGGAGGFPFPFGDEEGGQEGQGLDPSQEKVEIPGAEAYRVPDAFRKDLLDAMKQGSPAAYQGEVQRYYEELVK